ncbi:N-acetyltransferase, partial [Morganella morganii]|nr:N-acetyltransferase [Morganella morganii]
MDNLKYLPFKDINLNDTFFDSLKSDYSHGFIAWFNKKANDPSEKAYVLYEETGNIDGFLYLKIESGSVDDIEPPIKNGLHLKIGTFKFSPKGTLRGQRFLKKIFDNALS